MTLEIWLVYKGTKGNSPFNRDTPSWFAVYLNKGKKCHPSKTLGGDSPPDPYGKWTGFHLPSIPKHFIVWITWHWPRLRGVNSFWNAKPPEKNTVHMVTPVVAAWLFLLFFDEKIPRPKIRQTPSGSTADPMGLRLGSPKIGRSERWRRNTCFGKLNFSCTKYISPGLKGYPLPNHFHMKGWLCWFVQLTTNRQKYRENPSSKQSGGTVVHSPNCWLNLVQGILPGKSHFNRGSG